MVPFLLEAGLDGCLVKPAALNGLWVTALPEMLAAPAGTSCLSQHDRTPLRPGFDLLAARRLGRL